MSAGYNGSPALMGCNIVLYIYIYSVMDNNGEMPRFPLSIDLPPFSVASTRQREADFPHVWM